MWRELQHNTLKDTITSNVIYANMIKDSVLVCYPDCKEHFNKDGDDLKYYRLWMLYLLVCFQMKWHTHKDKFIAGGLLCYSGRAFLSIYEVGRALLNVVVCYYIDKLLFI